MAHFRALICVALAAVFLLIAASDADAQRRRRRRRRPPPQETQEPAQPENADQAPDQEAGDGATAAGEAAPAGEGDATADPLADEAAGPAAAVDGADADEPAADPFLDAEGPDLGPIREEFTAIMDELVQVRSRVAVLGRQLFRTRMTVSVQNRAADDNSLARMVLKLDGAPIFQGEGGEVSEDGAQVFDGFAAPGPHVLTIEVEQRARANDEYRYELRDTYRFQVIRDRLIEVTIVLDDDSDIAEDFEDDEEGEFDVRTRMRVATRALSSQ